MIQMPRRSVTRFFIPLIDVLILLFCIFLLMEFNSDAEVNQQSEVVEDQSSDINKLQAMLRDRIRELQQFEDDRPKLQEIAMLRKKLALLEKPSQRTFFRVIDINRHDGTIAFFDDARPDKPIKIVNEKIARELIERHQQEANGRELYYYFMRTRPTEDDIKNKRVATGYPGRRQVKQYEAMFPVPNNLGEYR